MEARPELHPLYRPVPEEAERVKTLKPYDPVSSLDKIQQNPGIEHFKLDWNESTIPPSPKVLKTLIEYLGNGSKLNWYPNMHYRPLYEKLATYARVEQSQLLLTNGSDACLELICKTFLNPTDNVVYPVPTYNHFIQFAGLSGAQLRGINGANPFLPTLEELEAHIDEQTKIVYLVNPNNPTGHLYPQSKVLAMARRHPHVLLVVDEAYYEFAGMSCAGLIQERANIIITRSFSKALSLAGLRLGYMIAQDIVLEKLRRVHNPKSVNMLAQVAAVAVLDDIGYYKAYVRQVKRSAALVEAFCKLRNLPCRPTYANWILIQFEDAPAMARKLAEAGVHVRDRSKYLPKTLRLSLGTEEQTREVLNRLGRILDSQ
jgi:histidinol-phosphate aminotransferase